MGLVVPAALAGSSQGFVFLVRAGRTHEAEAWAVPPGRPPAALPPQACVGAARSPVLSVRGLDGCRVRAPRVVWACASFHLAFTRPFGCLSAWGTHCVWSGAGGGGRAAGVPETDSWKGEDIFSCISPPGLSPRGGASCLPESGRGLEPGSFLPPEPEASLAHCIFPWRTHSVSSRHFSFLVTTNCFQFAVQVRFGEGDSLSGFSSPVRGLPLRERSAVLVTMAGKGVHASQRRRRSGRPFPLPSVPRLSHLRPRPSWAPVI